MQSYAWHKYTGTLFVNELNLQLTTVLNTASRFNKRGEKMEEGCYTIDASVIDIEI